MLDAIWQAVGQLIQRGGWVMWPLLVLSIASLALLFERMWFWVSTNGPWRRDRLGKIARHLREGNEAAARALIESDRTVYGRLIESLINEGATDAVATEAVERQRPRMDRFMPTLGTVITAAPMLGILGTVTGIIGAFNLFGTGDLASNPADIGPKIGEALITTVAGLIVALVVLFPYNAFNAQIERTLGRMETLIAAARRTGQARDDHRGPR
jgi:biopolymer transport protein ExbB